MLTKRNLILVVGLIVLVSVLVSIAELRAYRDSERTRVDVENELAQIPPPAAATFIRHDVVTKGSHGVVSNSYQSDLSYEQIRAHYDKELPKHGWIFREQHPLTFRGREVGQSETIYCKGTYAANIFFTGTEQANVGFRYGLNLSWGLDHCT